MLVVLDSGPLGLLSNPTTLGEPRDIREWAFRLLDEGVNVVVPEIADYEVRRELIRADKQDGIRRLDELTHGLEYEPLGTSHFRRAAELWAEARNRGLPTGHDAALDGDVLLAAQALGLMVTDPDTVVVTTNPEHLVRFVRAVRWRDL
ncbi:MAG: type II toxin-antitoxin system VapC family toxin [Acidimicrobiales bacterium]